MPLKGYTYYNRLVTIPKDYELMVSMLIDARFERSLSQERLAHKMGCTTSLIHKWETHKRIPSGFMLICWLDALGYDITVTKR
jgi:transcriptional regulator with XRE-family HTH domain